MFIISWGSQTEAKFFSSICNMMLVMEMVVPLHILCEHYQVFFFFLYNMMCRMCISENKVTFLLPTFGIATCSFFVI